MKSAALSKVFAIVVTDNKGNALFKNFYFALFNEKYQKYQSKSLQEPAVQETFVQ